MNTRNPFSLMDLESFNNQCSRLDRNYGLGFTVILSGNLTSVYQQSIIHRKTESR